MLITRGLDHPSHPSLKVPSVTPTSSPIVPYPAKREVVIFCGYPALGKTRFYRQHFEPLKYTHINQDTLKTREKCVKAVREALKRGESCVVGMNDWIPKKVEAENLRSYSR